eukprot:Hpha_TRINITY_DN1990_c0_g1::TRINITY_DN1990_c0_g1_i1::g.30986::m.30986
MLAVDFTLPTESLLDDVRLLRLRGLEQANMLEMAASFAVKVPQNVPSVTPKPASGKRHRPKTFKKVKAGEQEGPDAAEEQERADAALELAFFYLNCAADYGLSAEIL